MYRYGITYRYDYTAREPHIVTYGNRQWTRIRGFPSGLILSIIRHIESGKLPREEHNDTAS